MTAVIGGFAILGCFILAICAIIAIMWAWDNGLLEFLFWLGLAGFILYRGAIEFYQGALWLGDKIMSWGVLW